MNKLRKIMAMALSGVMMFSQVAFAENAQTRDMGNDDVPYVISVSEGLARSSVQFDGSKKKEIIEVNLEQDMWYGWYFDNQTDNDVSITEIGDSDDVRPVSHLSAKISGGVYPQKGSEPLKKGKYTFVIESLGENNLKGFFEYTFSSKAPDNNPTDYIRNDGPKLYIGEAQPIVIYKNTSLEKVQDKPAQIWVENPDNEAMFELQKYGIIEGDPNGDIRPYTTITRAEMAKVLCKALLLPEMGNGKSAFSDMTSAHWAYGYIETAYGSGIIDGNDDGTFAPDNDVKFSEAVKMIVTALGYKPLAEQRGGFPHGYAQIASQNGITKDIDHALDVPCKRNIVFKMLHNALDVPFMLQTGFGAKNEYQIADGKNGTPYQTFRSLITGTEIIPVQKYDEEYMNELKKFMENGEYYDEIAAEVGRFRNYNELNIKYTFEIISVELNEDATEVTVNTKITPENSSEGVKYLALNYKKVDGKWKF